MLHRFLQLAVLPFLTLTAPADDTRVDCDTDFAFRLYRTLADDQEDFVLSPFSVSAALGMASGGAAGRTREELRTVLGAKMDEAAYHAQFPELLTPVRNARGSDHVRLSIHNAVFLQEGAKIHAPFQTLLTETYACELSRVDFRDRPQGAVALLNRLIRQGTNGRGEPIRHVDVPFQTQLILVNTFYFKGQWASRFSPNLTIPRPFYPTKDRPINVRTMYQEQEYPLAVDADTIFLEMPYRGNRFSMIVVLPKPHRDLREIEQGLDAQKWRAWRADMTPQKLQLHFPRFAFTSRHELAPLLTAMGARTAFDPEQADFTRISDVKPLFINQAIHSAGIEVEESGTVAHAQTVLPLTGFGGEEPKRPKILHVNRPFLFVIQDNQTGSLLFMGRVRNPAPAGP
jgi:serine protease inhibitor